MIQSLLDSIFMPSSLLAAMSSNQYGRVSAGTKVALILWASMNGLELSPYRANLLTVGLELCGRGFVSKAGNGPDRPEIGSDFGPLFKQIGPSFEL